MCLNKNICILGFYGTINVEIFLSQVLFLKVINHHKYSKQFVSFYCWNV